MNSYELHSAYELRDLIRSGQLSPVDLTEVVLAKIRQLNPRLNCFSSVMEAEALRSAEALEKEIADGNGDQLPLAGIPISIKDLIGIKGVSLTHGSKLSASTICNFDAPLVERLRRAGAIIVGKTTTSEFGGKAVGDSPLTGVTRNPWNLAKTSGGSSAGAAASVAAGMTPCAIGTDGGGSVRIPAAMTGVVGFKPTFGRIPIYPEAFAPSLAHAGVLSRSVRDAALITSVIAGHDLRDPRSLKGKLPDYLGAGKQQLCKVRIGWSSSLGYATPEPSVLKSLSESLNVFEGLGCEVEEIKEPFWSDPADSWNRIFYSGLKRHLEEVDQAWKGAIDPAIVEMVTRFGKENEEADETVRQEIRLCLDRVFSHYDLLLTPTLPGPAFDILRNAPPGFPPDYPVTWSQYTYPFNLSGHPAISLPGTMTADRLPVGIQLIADCGRECEILRVAGAYEAQCSWGSSYPFLNENI